MTNISGFVTDVGMVGSHGRLIVQAVEFSGDGDEVVVPSPVSFPISSGVVSASVSPGPARLTIHVGSSRRDWFVNVPESDVGLGDLIEAFTEYEPPVVSAAIAARDAARQARDEAVAAAGDAAGDAFAAGVSAGDASAAAGAAAQSASGAAGSASGAASSAGAAAQSASSADGSASDAAGAVVDARAARDAAEGHASSATGSALAAAGSASAADGHAGRAEAAANEFGLSVTSSTLAPGSPATVTVSGDGPAYSLAFGVPQGPKGDKGDEGEISQAQLDAAVAGKADLVSGRVPTSQLPAAFPPEAHQHGVTDMTATGTRSSSTFLRGDNTWATPPNTTYSVPTQAEAEAGTATTARAFSAQRVRQAIDARAVTREGSTQGLWIGTAVTLPATGTAGVLYVTYE